MPLTHTNDIEQHLGAQLWLSPYLTLVVAVVLFADIFHLQRPHTVRSVVERVEAFIRNERHPVHGKNMVVAPPYPGYGLVADLADLQQRSIQLWERKGSGGIEVIINHRRIVVAEIY